MGETVAKQSRDFEREPVSAATAPYLLSQILLPLLINKPLERDLSMPNTPNSSEDSSQPAAATRRSVKPVPEARHVRHDSPQIDPSSLWAAFSQTPGVGVSITDLQGRLLFVNDTSKVLFSCDPNVPTEGKTIADYHSPEFTRERLAMIKQVVEQKRPLRIRHIYHGHPIESTLWPTHDTSPPFDRVIVVSRERAAIEEDNAFGASDCETISSGYIGLGPLQVLTRRELEVLVILGHGRSVPEAAAILHRSPKTVERHKASISEKLHTRGHAELVQIVTSMGLELDDVNRSRLPG